MPMPAIDLDKMLRELEQLDAEYVQLDGKLVKPTQCYYLDINPPHVLFNTNCPADLQSKIERILSTYASGDESRS